MVETFVLNTLKLQENKKKKKMKFCFRKKERWKP